MAWALILTGCLAFLSLLAGAALWLLRRRRALPQRRSRDRLNYPIVLAHGVMGFDAVELRGIRRAYFNGIAERLRQLGGEVHAVRVSPTGSIERRARDLAQAVASIPAERVNIIAHSMGGLDARYAISRLGLSTRIASLTTIGTPHRGTPLADLGTGLLGDRLGLRRVLAAVGLDVDAFYDLTVRRMETFNAQVPDHPDVMYGSYVAAVSRGLGGVNKLLAPTYLYLARQYGENDGVVPGPSQPWGEVLGRLEADHWAQIGWSASFDAPSFYLDVARELIRRGV